LREESTNSIFVNGVKRSEIYFSAIQLPVDFLMIVLAALSAYAVRDVPQILALRPKLYSVDFVDFLQVTLIIAPLFLIVYAIEGLYTMRATRTTLAEAFKVFRATSLVLVLVIVTIFLKREWFSSRFIILAGWSFMVMYVTIARYIIQRVQKYYLARKGVGVHRILLVGTNGKIERLKQLFATRPELGYVTAGQVEAVSLHTIKDIRTANGIDEIMVCDPSLTDDEQEKLLDYCQINNITLKYLPTTRETSRFTMSIFNGEPIIEFQHTPLDGWGKVLKRAFDIVGGVVLTILFSPIMLAIAILTKLEDPDGPIIYTNERIGEDGEKISVFKFRYMQWKWCINKKNPNFEAALEFEKQLIAERSVRQGPLYKIKDDPRKTKIGAFIERYSLDELPQFFNVLRGEMSLVGPRPHQKREVEKYSEYHRRLLTIKPGITGMAQVSGRSDLDFEDEFRLDVFYIENWSLWVDIVVCLKTAGALLRRRKN
jgi:exopolysaccharide biosynthesis polyprenyl glycosylphosphotransferase